MRNMESREPKEEKKYDEQHYDRGRLDVLIFCFNFDQGMPKQERERSQTDEALRAPSPNGSNASPSESSVIFSSRFFVCLTRSASSEEMVGTNGSE